MTRAALFFFVILNAILTAVAYFIGGQIIPAIAALILGAFWTFSLVRNWKWASTMSLFGVYALAVAGFILDLSPFLLTIAGFCAFLAWDLSDFTYRLSLAAPEDDTSALERGHWLWLSVVTIAGAAAVIAARVLRVKFTFEWMAGLLVFAVWGAAKMMDRLLRKE
jgi:hypothetical protein